MKRIIKTMVLTLCTIAILNNGTRMVKAKTIVTEFKNLTSSNSEIKGMNNCIDPDTEEK